jgi:hypothetical protein
VVDDRYGQRVRELFAAYLGAGEELRAVGLFETGGAWADVGTAKSFYFKNWFVGMTDGRVLLGKQRGLKTSLHEDGVLSVPRKDVVVRKTLLGLVVSIVSADPRTPRELRSSLLTRSDKAEFLKPMGE